MIELDPNFVPAYRNLGLVYTQINKYPEAIKVFLKSVEFGPLSVEAQTSLGLAYLMTNEYSAAARSLEQALELDPKYVQAYHYLGAAYTQIKKFPDAINVYLKAVELDPYSEAAHASLGGVYMMSKEYSAAARSLERALELRPEFPVHDVLSYAYEQLGRKEDLERLRNQPRDRQPRTALQHFVVARDLIYAGQREEAIASYQKAISLDPTLIEAHRDLAGLFIDKKQFKEAIPLLRQIIDLGGESAPVYQQLGFAYYRLDQLAEGAEAYREAVKLDPESAKTYESLSAILVSHGIPSDEGIINSMPVERLDKLFEVRCQFDCLHCRRHKPVDLNNSPAKHALRASSPGCSLRHNVRRLRTI